jgi:hypothetical protein
MTKRYEKEFTDEEIDSMVQEFRRGMKEEHPDENEEVFPNNAEELRAYIISLEENYKHNPTESLREELRVYKAHQTGIYKGFCISYEQLMSEADKVKREHPADEEEEEIKPTLFDGGPMFKDEEEFKKMKKVLADDPDTPKGHWVEDGQMKTYMFDKPKKQK